MSNDEKRIKHERAKEQGRSCRRNGGKRESNPYRGASLTSERDSWWLGFDEEESARKVRR
jgi:hypothetical protein